MWWPAAPALAWPAAAAPAVTGVSTAHGGGRHGAAGGGGPCGEAAGAAACWLQQGGCGEGAPVAEPGRGETLWRWPAAPLFQKESCRAGMKVREKGREGGVREQLQGFEGGGGGAGAGGKG